MIAVLWTSAVRLSARFQLDLQFLCRFLLAHPSSPAGFVQQPHHRVLPQCNHFHLHVLPQQIQERPGTFARTERRSLLASSRSAKHCSQVWSARLHLIARLGWRWSGLSVGESEAETQTHTEAESGQRPIQRQRQDRDRESETETETETEKEAE